MIAPHMERWQRPGRRSFGERDRAIVREHAANIGQLFITADDRQRQEGMEWYGTAHGIAASLAASAGLTTLQTAAVISATSPGMQWDDNVTAATALIGAWADGATEPDAAVRPGVTFGPYQWRYTVHKAWAILTGPADDAAVWDRFTPGSKTHQFLTCIAHPEHPTAVAVDSHTYHAAVYGRSRRVGSSSAPSLTALRRDRIALAHVEVAMRYAPVLPQQVQAIAWTVYREMSGAWGHDAWAR